MPIRDQKVNRSWINSEVNIPYYQILPGSASRDGSLAYQNSNTSLYIWKENKWNRIFSAGDITFSNSLAGGATLVNNSPQIGPNFVLKNIYFRDLLVPTNGPNNITFDCTALDSISTRNWKAGTNSSTGPSDEVVIGDAATSSGLGGNVVLGSAVQCTSAQDSIAVGKGTTVSNSDVISIGSGTTSYDKCVSIGSASNGISQSVEVGFNATTTAQESVSLGYGTVSDDGTVSVGHQSQGQSQDTAVGNNAINHGSFSVAIGKNASTTGDRSISIGYSSSSHTDSVSVGYQTSAPGKRSVSLNSLTAGGDDTVALGYNSSATGVSKGVVIGSSSSITDVYSISVGYASSIQGSRSTVYGTQSACNASNSLALGAGTTLTVTSNQSIAIGYASSVDASYSISLGQGIINDTADTTMIGNSDSYIVNSPGFYKSVNQYCINTKAPFDTPSSEVPIGGYFVDLNLVNVDFATNPSDFISPCYAAAPEPNQMYILSVNFYVRTGDFFDTYFFVDIYQLPYPGVILSSTTAAVAVYPSNYFPFSSTLLVKTLDTTSTVFFIRVSMEAGFRPSIFATQVSLVRVT